MTTNAASLMFKLKAPEHFDGRREQQLLEGVMHESGEMWEQVCDRTITPVTVHLGRGFSMHAEQVYDLTLPSNEHHPFWRVEKRDMTEEESDELIDRYSSRSIDGIGALMNGPHGRWVRVKAHIRNGRTSHWLNSIEYVDVAVTNPRSVLSST